MRSRSLIALALPFLVAAAAPAREQRIVESCATLDECIAVTRDPALKIRHIDSHVDQAILKYGDAAVDALVPLLNDPNPETRENAAYLVSGFRHIPPRHFAALVAAWRRDQKERGNGWLPRAVAATGTDEALRLLWTEFEREPIERADQVVFALTDFGSERIRPLVLERFAKCESDASRDSCRGLDGFFRAEQFGGFGYPPWALDAYVRLAEGAASEQQRFEAATILVRLQHPAGLAPYQKLLADYARPEEGSYSIQAVIEGIADYGPAARSSGPVIARFLAARDEEVRAAAALAIGKVGDTSSVPALKALEPKLGDDWGLAYNVAESLGRLHATEGVPLLEGLARNYWHKAVRNNATRALNAIAGGAFALPGVPGDPKPYSAVDSDGTVYLYTGNLRYDADRPSTWCAAPHATVPFERDPVGSIAWARPADRVLDFEPVGEDTIRRLRARTFPEEARGRIMAVLPTRNGTIVGLNAGEFGGGLYFLPFSGAATKLNDDRVVGAWRMGGRLYVAAGIAHGVGEDGHLYVIDPDGPTIERAIRLPGKPRSISVARAGAVIVATNEGDVGVTPDGRLVDPATVGRCARE